MNTMLKVGLASVLTVASLATMSVPAQARDWNGGGYRGGDGAGAAIAGGVIGLALGAAIASSNNHDDGYRSSGYGSGYYGSNNGYAPGYGERQCLVRRQVWDTYDGRYEVRRVPVPC